MKKSMCMAVALAGAVLFALPCVAQDIYTGGTPACEELGWRVGCQAYSFNRFTFFEAVDKVAQMGLKWIEAYPGQRLSKDLPEDVKLEHTMSAEHQKLALDYLKSKGVTLVNYGVVGIDSDEAGARKIFDFAKAMGIETIVSEPPKAAFPMLDKLTQEYNINIAIHNHPKPSLYWNYKKVLEVTEGLNPRIGACADTGHWMRSGIESLEAVKALLAAKRIISFHFKDLNEMSREAHDVPWGTGVTKIKDICQAMKDAGWKGTLSAEYEWNWDNSVPEISKAMQNLNDIVIDLGNFETKLPTGPTGDTKP